LGWSAIGFSFQNSVCAEPTGCDDPADGGIAFEGGRQIDRRLSGWAFTARFGRRNRSLSSKEMIAAVLLLGKCQVALVLMLGSYGRVR
jgi:hypothetical protein